jgi:hypothetical protein
MNWRWAAATAATVALVLLFAPGAASAGEPRYRVPPGYTRCPEAIAWNGFFRWASVRDTTCDHAARFMRAYADAATEGPMPHRLHAFRCRLHFWRNADGDVYASRHDCERGAVAIRFYGMV